MRSRLCFVLSLLLVALLPTWASANPTVIADNGPRLATPDGTVWVGEYPGASVGINAGFGNVIGVGTTLSVDSGAKGLVNFGLDGSAPGVCSANNLIVVYIDSKVGGFPDTTAFTDFGDAHRAAISARGLTAPGRAEITFALGFEADYAIAINRDFAGLWELTTGAHNFLSPLFATPSGLNWDDNCDFELAGLTLANLGLAPGGSFDYVVTLVNPNDGGGAYRSDEFHGVASTTITGNPGINPIVLSAGDFNTFTSVGPYPIINEVDSDQASTDTAEFVELWDGGVGNLSLDGLVLVLHNGGLANDPSYQAFDLTGHTTSASGFFILGTAALSPDIALPGTSALQNGADAVALYAGVVSSYSNGTPLSATNLIDLVVYGNNNSDDITLLPFLVSGPQVNEAANGLGVGGSSQRCPDGAGGFRVTDDFLAATPTLRAANNCPAACVVDADCATCEVCGTTGYCEPATNGLACDLDSSFCTLDSCQAGTCTAGAAVDCTSSNTDCQTASCDGTSGLCSIFADKLDGTVCDLDAIPCTLDTCQTGACAAGSNTCECMTTADCAGMEDGNLCNGTLICTGNTCVVDATTVVTCDASGDTACLANTCAPSTGVCSMQNANEAGSCDDGDACTVSDVCTAGTCGGSAMDCSGSDTACQTASCNSGTGACTSMTDRSNGTSCNDGDACTTIDSCQTGACVGAAPVDCSGSDTDCQTAACDSGTGACTSMTDRSNGTACDDGDACTTIDSCQTGACVGAAPVDCSGSDTACQTAACDGTSGLCSIFADKLDGTVCDLDAIPCTLDTCQTGACAAGSNTCECMTTADCAVMEDGNLCNGTLICTANTCVVDAATIVTCDASGDTACLANTCAPSTGVCSLQNANEAGSCDDGNACTVSDVCTAGTCGGSAMDCSGSDTACQTASCNAGACTTLTDKADDTVCDLDSSMCTPDTCQTGTCTAGTPVDCSSSDTDCQTASCNPGTGACSVMNNVLDGTSCDLDSSMCTPDTCQIGMCTIGTPVDCSSFDTDCQTSSCNSGTGACTTFSDVLDGTSCDLDATSCTPDTCLAGSCSAGTNTCDCLVDADCAGSEDGDLCNGTLICTANTCVVDASTVVTCDASGDTACLANACTPSTGLCSLQNTNEAGSCDDGDACTVSDVCTAGTCGGSAMDCSGSDTACQTASCNAGACTTLTDKADDTVCDLDSSMCTADTCQAGACTAGAVVDCSSSDTACQTAACDAGTGACTTMTDKANDTVCDLDSSMCTPDTCQTGACTAGTPLDCSGSDTACQTASCNAGTGACTTMTNKTNNTSCDLDGTTCTPDTCQAGTCSAGTNTCACMTTADCTASEDGDLCNGTLICTNNACVVDATTVVTCDTAADGTCTANTCDGATGVCAMVNLNEGGSCDDANSCTDADLCTAGVCAGTPLATGTDCSDDCNTGVCNVTTGLCEATPLVDGTTCDDGSDCTETDECSAGVCSGTTLADDTACDDGDLCTDTDICTSGVCAGTDLDCSLLDNACNVGTCNSADGACVATAMADGTSCDDGEQCTETDECSAGVCGGTAAADGTACDDADTCTEGEICEAGLCSGGSDVCTIGDEVAEPVDDVAPDGTSDAGITDLSSGAETSAELKGGGCQCQVSTQKGTSPALPMGLLLGLIGLFVIRRRRG